MREIKDEVIIFVEKIARTALALTLPRKIKPRNIIIIVTVDPENFSLVSFCRRIRASNKFSSLFWHVTMILIAQTSFVHNRHGLSAFALCLCLGLYWNRFFSLSLDVVTNSSHQHLNLVDFLCFRFAANFIQF